MFRFHTGSIKSALAAAETLTKKRFDSILVRLKARVRNHFHRNRVCFDSILVRLKVNKKTLAFEFGYVSIPYWFD